MKPILFVVTLLLFISGFSQTIPEKVKITEIPYPLQWVIKPEAFIQKNDTIEITAGSKTNMFFAPHGHFNVSNMPKLLFQPDSDFVFSAKATAYHQSKWEAAMLVVYIDESYWAKLCFENQSPGVQRMVSVVTNEISDDAYSDIVNGNSIYMQVSKKGKQIVFSYSQDAKNWIGIRYFRLNSDKPIKVGFASQSPIGNGLTSVFSGIEYTETTK